MEFFDRKEEVLDVQLTQYGKHLLSMGRLKPAFYSFFDSDIDYDKQYQGNPPSDSEAETSPTENQKDTVDRIKQAPRIKAVHSVDTVEKTHEIMQFPILGEVVVEEGNTVTNNPGTTEIQIIGWEEVKVPMGEIPFKTNDFLDVKFGDFAPAFPRPEKQNTIGLEIPLGKSGYNSNYYPAFDLNFAKGKIKSSIYYEDNKFGIFRIPQLEIDVTYETTVANNQDYILADGTLQLKDIVSIKDSSEAADYNYTQVSDDGTYVKVEEDYIYINLRELNSFYDKEDFELEVYEVENPDTDNEILRPLMFSGDYLNDLFSDYYYDKTNNSLEVNNKFVEYYFKVTFDDEIKKPISEPSGVSLPTNDFEVCED